MARRTSGDVDHGVDGLAELNRALKQIERHGARAARKTNKTVADLVANDAQSAARSLGSTAAHVAPSLKAIGGGALRGRGAWWRPGYPMAPAPSSGPTSTSSSSRGAGAARARGYFLWPTIRSEQERIEAEYGKGMDDLLRRADLV